MIGGRNLLKRELAIAARQYLTSGLIHSCKIFGSKNYVKKLQRKGRSGNFLLRRMGT
jgi:hypothetical protein